MSIEEIDYVSVLPLEMLQLILSYDVENLFKYKGVNKKFYQAVHSLYNELPQELKKIIYFNHRLYQIENLNNDSEQIIKQIQNPKLSHSEFRQLIDKMANQYACLLKEPKPPIIIQLNTNIESAGARFRDELQSLLAKPIINVIFIVISLFVHLYYLGYKTRVMDDLDVLGCDSLSYCQTYLNKVFQYSFVSAFAAGASVGFFAKAVYGGICAGAIFHALDNPQILPQELTSLTRKNNILFNVLQLFKKTLPLHDVPFLIWGVLRSVARFKHNPHPFSLDIRECEFSSIKMNIDCLGEVFKKESKEVHGDNFAQGFLYAFSTINLLLYLFAFITLLGMKARNTYQAYQRDRVFTPVVVKEMNSNSIVIDFDGFKKEEEITPLLARRYKK